MGALDGNKTRSTAAQTTATLPVNTEEIGIGNIGTAVHTPRFMPANLLDLSVCKSQEDLDKAKAALAEFRKVVAWTKQKFAAQRTAADLALELAKSQNELVSHFAKTVVKQAKSDAELAALLGALPGMLTAITGTVEQKKEQKVRTFTERLSAAGKGQTTTKKK